MTISIQERELMHNGIVRPLSQILATKKEYTWATKPTASEFGRGQAWFSDIGAMGYSNGVEWILENERDITSTVFNSDGTIASATISGITYTFTYSNGKLSTVVCGTKTTTYTWTNELLTSVSIA